MEDGGTGLRTCSGVRRHRTGGRGMGPEERLLEWRGESFRSGPSMFGNPEDVNRLGKVTHRQGSSSLHGG